MNLNLNYIIIKNIIVHQYKILSYYFYHYWYIIYVIVYIKNAIHDTCHHVFMYDGRDKNINSQTNGQLNIYQIYMEVFCKINSIATR